MTVDRRLLPGQTPEDVDPIVRSVLGEDGLRAGDDRALRRNAVPARHAALAARSPVGSRTTEPGAKLAPLCCAGFTDSHWLREAFGTVAYGFFPLQTMETELAARLIHSADERTHVDDLEPRRRVPPRRRPLAGVAVLELHSPEGAFEQIEAYLRERGFFAPGGEALEADLYLGYGLSEPLRRTTVAGAAGAVPAAARGRGRAGHVPGPVPGTRLGRTVGADAGPSGLRARRSRRCARRSGAATSTR